MAVIHELEDGTSEEVPSYVQEVPEPAVKKRRPWWHWTIAVLILAIIAAAAGFLLRNKPAKPASTQQPAASSSSQSQAKDIANATGTKSYTSNFVGVSFTYPDNWTVTEADDRNSLRIESPQFSYTSLDKGQVTGNFRIYIRKGARDIDEKYIGRGYAIESSTKLIYSKPAVGQRSDTNLTLFGLDTPDNFAFFLIAGNFTLSKGDTLGPNYGREAETYIIGGGFSTPDQKDDLATHPVTPDQAKASNAYKQAQDILKSLQLS